MTVTTTSIATRTLQLLLPQLLVETLLLLLRLHHQVPEMHTIYTAST